MRPITLATSAEHERASESATCVGCGSAASAWSRDVAPVSTSAESMPARRAPATSTSSRSPTREVAARPEPVAAPPRTSPAPACRPHGRPCGRVAASIAASMAPRAGPRPVGHRERRGRGVAPISSAPRSTACVGDPQLRRSRTPSCAADDDDVRARGERRVVDDPQPGVGDVVDERLRRRPRTPRRARRPASTNCTAAPTVTHLVDATPGTRAATACARTPPVRGARRW